MNSCEKYEELISMMQDGELSAQQHDELMAHISACEDCRRIYDAFAAVSEAFSEDELVDVPEGFAADVMAKIPAGSSKIIPMRKKTSSWMRYGTVAACFVLVVLGVTRLPVFSGEKSASTTAAAAPSSIVVAESFFDVAEPQAPAMAPMAPSAESEYMAYTAGSTKETVQPPVPMPEAEAEISYAEEILNLDSSDVEMLITEVETVISNYSGPVVPVAYFEEAPVLTLEGESDDGDVITVNIYEQDDGSRMSVSYVNGVENVVVGDLSELIDTAN